MCKKSEEPVDQETPGSLDLFLNSLNRTRKEKLELLESQGYLAENSDVKNLCAVISAQDKLIDMLINDMGETIRAVKDQYRSIFFIVKNTQAILSNLFDKNLVTEEEHSEMLKKISLKNPAERSPI